MWLTEAELSRVCNGALKSVEVPTSGAGRDVLVVDSLPMLVQAIGHLKYSLDGPTFLRGQRLLYRGELLSNLFREPGSLNSRINQIDAFVRTSNPWKCKHADHAAMDCPERIGRKSDPGLLLRGTSRYAAEPILQHYGLKTRWIDVVDNLWSALWFACHRMQSRQGFMHMVRSVAKAPTENVYLLAINVPGKPIALPGLKEGESVPGYGKHPCGSHVIDLRIAAPSLYLRPHAQHGYLVRPNDELSSSLRIAAFQIPLPLALDWLGSSLLLSAFSFFPPATVDYGYAQLLRRSRDLNIPLVLGGINEIGPGY